MKRKSIDINYLGDNSKNSIKINNAVFFLNNSPRARCAGLIVKSTLDSPAPIFFSYTQYTYGFFLPAGDCI